jgi:hypothetical protein
MDQEEFIASLEDMGCEDVWLMFRPMDAGAKRGVGVSFHRGGQLYRHAVTIPSYSANKLAWSTLLDWVAEKQAA